MREKDNKKMLKNKNGITLIALIITIIVMLILVAVTITIAVNGGLFNYARNASVKTNEAMENEQLWASGSVIDYYLNRKSAVVGLTAYKDLTEDDFDEDGCITKNASYESGMAIAPIPKGFKISDKKDEQSIANGLVIQDADGNEFVWIPVKDGEFTRTAWFKNMTGSEYIAYMNSLDMTKDADKTKLKTDLATFYATDGGYEGYPSLEEAMSEQDVDTVEEYLDMCASEDWGYMTGDPTDMEDIKATLTQLCTLSADYTETVPNNLATSVSTYGGFYLARYEAGSTTARTSSSGATTMVVQKGAYPYNYINWNDAKTKSEGMYTGEDYGVTSTLCYGAQWDATLRFIRDKVNVTNSTTWGNYNNHTFEFDGKYTENPWDANPTWGDDETTKPNETGWLLTTGASEVNKAKNIYDLAGNVYEWTMEAYSSDLRVGRGGDCSGIGSGYPASNRYYDNPTSSNYYIGFRVTLYL